MRYIEILEYLGLEGIVEGFPYFTIVVAILLAFVITIVGMPKAIKHLRNLGEVTPDKYKKGESSIPTKGGIATLMASLFTLCFIALFSKFSLINFVIMFIILTYAFFGILDDYIHIKNRWWNIAVPFFFAFPLIFIIDLDITQYPFFGQITPGPIFFILVVPLYVLVVSNLVNMHSGFNGLQSGLSSIIFIFLFIKIFLSNNLDYMIAPACIAGSNFGFWLFNRYPARILEGNIGSLVNGATIGIMIVISGFLLAGFVMLIPHTINFLMYFYWRLQRSRKSKYGYGNDSNMNPYYGSHKFGRLRNDGTIEVPNRLTLKWFLPFHFRMTEKQATRAMYAITTGFCIIGLFIPY